MFQIGGNAPVVKKRVGERFTFSKENRRYTGCRLFGRHDTLLGKEKSPRKSTAFREKKIFRR